ncbi:IS4 family transposase, partial [Vibrio vulnificus]
INALFLIMDEMIWASDTRSPGAIPKNLKILRDSGKRLILPKNRKPYPRAVLKKPARYPNKHATRS